MKKYLCLLFTSLVLFSLTGCINPPQSEAPSEESDVCLTPPAPGEDCEKADEKEGNDYIGLTVEQAQALAQEEGVPFRVVERDGEALPVTMDWRPGRINATVENGIIVDYEVEGGE